MVLLTTAGAWWIIACICSLLVLFSYYQLTPWVYMRVCSRTHTHALCSSKEARAEQLNRERNNNDNGAVITHTDRLFNTQCKIIKATTTSSYLHLYIGKGKRERNARRRSRLTDWACEFRGAFLMSWTNTHAHALTQVDNMCVIECDDLILFITQVFVYLLSDLPDTR